VTVSPTMLFCIPFAGSYAAFADGGFVLNPIADYAHLAGRGLIRHVLPAGNEILFTHHIYFLSSGIC